MVSTSSTGVATNMDLPRKSYDHFDRVARIRRMADEMSIRANPVARAREELDDTGRPFAQSIIVSQCHASSWPSRTVACDDARSNAIHTPSKTQRPALVRDDEYFWSTSHVCGSVAHEAGDVSFHVPIERNVGNMHNGACATEVVPAEALANSGAYGFDLAYLRQHDHDRLSMRALLKSQVEKQEQQQVTTETELSVQAEEFTSYGNELERIRRRSSDRFPEVVCSGPTTRSIDGGEDNCKPHHFISNTSRSLVGARTTRRHSLPADLTVACMSLSPADTPAGSGSCFVERRSSPAVIPFASMSFVEKLERIRGRLDTYDRSRRILGMADDMAAQAKPVRQDQETNKAAESGLQQCTTTHAAIDSLAVQREVVRERTRAVKFEDEEQSNAVDMAQLKPQKPELQRDFWSASHICGSITREIPISGLEPLDDCAGKSRLSPYRG